MAPPVSTYRERLPMPALASHVLCVWSQVIGGATTYSQRVLPDGCVDLVWIGEAPAVVAGPATGPVVAALAPGSVVIGARIRPGAAAALLDLPASELLDRQTPLAEIRRTDAWCARVPRHGSIPARLAATEAALARRIADAGPPDPSMAAATRWLARRPAGRVEDLARFLDMGGRRLHRRFVAAVGYGPKTFQRVLRLQRVLALAGRSRHAGLAALAAEAGYADQAHMSREVRALTGCSPRELLDGASSTLALSDLFKTDAAPTL